MRYLHICDVYLQVLKSFCKHSLEVKTSKLPQDVVPTLVFLINVQARLFFGGSISPLHTHFYLVPARLLGTTYILIRPTLPISGLHAYLALHVY